MVTTPALVAAVAQLDQQVKNAQPARPQRWHVWLSDEGRVWATHVKTNGMAETVDADTPSKMLGLLIDMGVRL